ncbi:MAG TPA: RNA methyltransferase [Polyangiaceae bacterium]
MKTLKALRKRAEGSAAPNDFSALLAGLSPRQAIAVLEPLAAPERCARIAGVVNGRIGRVTVLMDAPHDPHNGAAVIRSADAFGLPEIHVVPRVEPFLIGRRVTQGTERWVEVVQHPTPAAALAALGARNFELVATHPEGELVPEDLPSIDRLCLVLGNEHDGICEELRLGARRSVRIPMRGFVESLNVSVAAALLLRAATLGREGDLPAEERERLYAVGLARSVPRATEILAASGR